MKRCQSLLLCALVMFSASADSTDTRLFPGHFSGDVLKDIRATTVFVQEQAIKAAAPNRWLIALAACGLIVLQLRRKHKSLPQRRIVPYA